MEFVPPTSEQVFALRISAGIGELAQNERFADATADMVEAIVAGIGDFAAGTWAPLSMIGDREGARLTSDGVRLPAGHTEAYRQFVEAGWSSIAAPAEHGGQGLPFALAVCILETLGAANMGFTLLPILTVGAIDALHHHGSEAQKAHYLPRLISGEWPGTMNLTEPQAGSDVGALRTTAVPVTDGPHAGKYRIKGTKIFISWGEHDLAENILHLVLARLPGAPEGSRGVSLFLVPRRHVLPDGSLGSENDVRAVNIERKLGIHASPTCVMSFGDNDECYGELIGRENGGLAAMFTMMNSARINVGGQGVQIAEAALQKAMAFAQTRVQSVRAGQPGTPPVPIIEHPDVRRMLLRMRALTEGTRALLYYTAGQVDRGALGDGAAQARADLCVPLVKAWATDAGFEVTSLGLQVHGGMGYIEETGAARLLRDARIPPIYEGTNGIQAADFVTRKLGMERGGVLRGLLAEIAAEAGDVTTLRDLCNDCSKIAAWMTDSASLDDRLAGSVPFTTMCAVAVAGWQLLRQARAAASDGTPADIARTKPVVARYFLDHLVPETRGLMASATGGASVLYALNAQDLAS